MNSTSTMPRSWKKIGMRDLCSAGEGTSSTDMTSSTVMTSSRYKNVPLLSSAKPPYTQRTSLPSKWPSSSARPSADHVTRKTNSSSSASRDLNALKSLDETAGKKWTMVSFKLTQSLPDNFTKPRVLNSNDCVRLLSRPRSTNPRGLDDSVSSTSCSPPEDDLIVLSTELLPRPWTMSSSRLIGPGRGLGGDPHLQRLVRTSETIYHIIETMHSYTLPM